MEHFFELPVPYKGETLLLHGRLVTFAFDYKLYIRVDGRELVLERDDAQELRVLGDGPDPGGIDPELIRSIVAVLESLPAIQV